MPESFPQRLSRLRKERHLNQRTAATALNISQALLSHYENGLREPGLPFLDAACRYYGVSADYLLGRSPLRISLSEAMEQLPEACAEDVSELLTLTLYRILRPYDRESDFALEPTEARHLCEAETALALLRLRADAGEASLRVPENVRERSETYLAALKSAGAELRAPGNEGRNEA